MPSVKRWWQVGFLFGSILLIALLNLPPTLAEHWSFPFHVQSLYSYSPLTLFCMLASFYPHRVSRARENTTKSKSVSHPFKSTAFPPLDPKKHWPDLPRWLKRLSLVPTSIPFAFPVRMGPFFQHCVLLIMSFYNMFLCLAGHTWDGWSCRVTKLAVPTPSEGTPTLADTYSTRPPRKPPNWTAPTQSRLSKASSLLLFGALCGAVSASPFELKSELQQTQRLRRLRSCLGN